jgi:hypothetical protein
MISILDLKRQTLALRGLRKGDAAANAGMNEAAMLQARTGQEALDWFRQEYANTAGDRAAAVSRSQELSAEQLEAMRTQNRIANDYDNYNRTTFRPLEQRMVAESQAYDTPERREAAAAEARADVQMATGRQQDALSRSLMRSGVNPGSGAALAARQGGALASASAEAGASNMARRRVEETGYARMADAAALGRNLPGQQAQAAATGIQAGGASQQASSAGLGAASSGADLLGQGFTQAMQGHRGAGQTYGAMASNAASSDASLYGALGSVAGAALMFMSDEKVKTDTDKPADTATMLEQVEDIPVKREWRYDPAKGGPDDGGVPHDGPMAGEVQQVMGDEVAPDGKAIDLISMNGRLVGAVQEVSKRLKRIERMVAA